MIKIITIDLDGTLLDSNKMITELNKEAIQEAKDLGVKIVIATGRPYLGFQNVIKELNLFNTDTYVICFNGGIIYHLLTNEIVYSSTISGKDVKELYQESLRLNVNIHAFKENQELISPKSSICTDLEASLNNIEVIYTDFNKIKDEDKFIKAMLVDPEEILDDIIPKMNSYWKDNFSVVRSAKVFLEILNLKAQKGVALETLAKLLNVDIKDTASFGDNENDLSMIISAGCGVAMQNAVSIVKEHAQMITEDNDNSGVGKGIKKLLNIK